MYTDQLKTQKVNISDIFLDPNNPRFWVESTRATVKDSRVKEAAVQRRTIQEIDKHGIDDLYNSILRNGFLLMDRIVVRQLKDDPGKYVVVEGNRRFRSLSKLRADIVDERVQEADVPSEDLASLLKNTNSLEVLVYAGDEAEDISWMFQGIRHISGIRDWEPAQRAKLVADQIDTHGKSLTGAGQHFGLSAIAAGRLYRTHRALSQMARDDEFSGKVRNDYFSLFEEAYRNTTIRGWLGWNEQESNFQNTDNLKRFYSWITPDEENQSRRRVHDPKQLKDVAFLIENDHKTLLSQVEGFILTIGEARLAATAGEPRAQDWRLAMRACETTLAGLPQSAMADDPEDFLESLQTLGKVVATRIKMVELVIAERLADED
ncbi:ParB N-terminal domain-containing protein [Stenotrophomonas maltophilia]|uniref:ParB N-terminal domain-containing protein n=1 Tax=Stenotrophomonas maltophilia TaxID=40324 RepID=UPI001F373A48|nr:ParB N-terminal domain-containing protein [Stenotrophomonas maltophilia]MCF3525252.1 ParB N-terminal domain-containing protein [Stenotrophomonas maltophilia]MCF3554422.1 ParB N-terminal domain-containing protein [Stenotrophomonas maltophilia]